MASILFTFPFTTGHLLSHKLSTMLHHIWTDGMNTMNYLLVGMLQCIIYNFFTTDGTDIGTSSLLLLKSIVVETSFHHNHKIYVHMVFVKVILTCRHSSSPSRQGGLLSRHAVLVSKPEIRAFCIQARIPLAKLRESDTDLRSNFITIIA